MVIDATSFVDKYNDELVTFAKRETPDISYLSFIENDRYYFSYLLEDAPFGPIYVPILKQDKLIYECSSKYTKKDIETIIRYPFDFIKQVNNLGLEEYDLIFRKKAKEPFIFLDFKSTFDDYITLLSVDEFRKDVLSKADNNLIEVLHEFNSSLDNYLQNINLRRRLIKKYDKFIIYIYPSKNKDNLAYGVEKFKMSVLEKDILSKILFLREESEIFLDYLSKNKITPLSYLLLFNNLFNGLRKVDTNGGGSFYLLDRFETTGLILPPFMDYFIKNSKYMLVL